MRDLRQEFAKAVLDGEDEKIGSLTDKLLDLGEDMDNVERWAEEVVKRRNLTPSERLLQRDPESAVKVGAIVE